LSFPKVVIGNLKKAGCPIKAFGHDNRKIGAGIIFTSSLIRGSTALSYLFSSLWEEYPKGVEGNGCCSCKTK
jgi:hypothetical protein